MSFKTLSDIAFIDVQTNNPFELFRQWQEEALQYLPRANTLNIMNLATCTKDGCVSNRNVLVLRYEPDGFVFLTDSCSRKAKEISENPNVAATFLWRYSNDKNEIVTRQVRVHGRLTEMSSEYTREVFDEIPTFRKIRYHLCEQGKVVDWNEMKEKHDKILEEVQNGRQLEMPPHAISYKLSPSGMEFYYDYDVCSSDRVLFTQHGEIWTYLHLSS